MDVTPERTPSMVADPPAVDTPTVSQSLLETYGVTARLTELRSERDRNFLAGTDLVVKVSNSGDDAGQIAMECAAMQHVEAVAPDLPIPRLLPTTAGEPIATLEAADGRVHQVRVITVLPGADADLTALPSWFAAEFGTVCAEFARALQGFGHPAAYRKLDWDPRLVVDLGGYVESVPDESRRTQLRDLLERFAGLEDATRGLPASVLHGDLTLSNVLIGDGRITGVIDFGDMHHTARVCDLAISLTSLLRESDDLWGDARQFLDAYQRVLPLDPAEVELIGELVLARSAASILISAWRAPLYPDNEEYLTSLVTGSWRILDEWAALTDLADRFHHLCGTSRVTTVADPTLLPRRRAALGGDLSPLFYREPLQVVRAAGAWVSTADGRRYLDAYNNVPVVGHAHPAVVQAISRQAAILNLNSRYLHPHAVELAERLVTTMPDGLDTCVFVNSGSEANDLAWRMARIATGRSGVLVADLAYHGVSEATAAWSTNTYPSSARPTHVGIFEAPRLSADGEQPTGADARERVRAGYDELRLAGHEVALLAVDSVFSSAGILTPGDDFMRGLQDEVREAGGLFLADEVQAGFGRGGRNLWRFLDFGLTPDFVTLGKPMGNGHPVAALITRREIAERFAAVDEFFSTFAGNPVSCVAALTVLDVIEERGLVARSGEIGDLLRAGLAELGTPARGQGLIVGVELPDAPDFAERLREYGVLVGTTGPGGGVLKIRPPLIWSATEVEYFIAAFQKARDRWT
ncbi:aminotransferase class III-fold pyridoxal phosphate-dependent enzyme [Kribbella jiaozuonensis]|uniref:Aminotransferase class III-fold pyridoxal phosphate-dependent enzyme n=1 Tax=Kribbella jiaozuonensis TaxID=2575441 RepID=A0A4U3LM86_9ACTN|nr:aminotransferase class III-fold pyridoxal phosphate-dependent enzyme [Kribbella jiaozuonensis]TKK76259.1 aminotransferase class III-fold pyridoxal phosphate-dependent enzyme [Kribbella jiaozuonensis]